MVRSRIVAISSRPGIVDDQLEEEAVELGFGQRIGAFLLDRVLRGHDEERLLQAWMVPPTVTLCSCIASSRADCVFGVARLISSASTIWAKIGPGLKAEDALAFGSLVDDVGADDVGGHQVGRELDAVELQVEHLGQRADQQRLAQAGHAFEQGMAADEQARQHAVDDVWLPTMTLPISWKTLSYSCRKRPARSCRGIGELMGVP